VKTVTFDPQGAEIGENCDGDGAARGGVAGERGGAAGGGGTLEQAENKRLKRLHKNKARNMSQKASPSHKGSRVQPPGGKKHKKRIQKALDILTRQHRVVLCPNTFSRWVVLL